MKGAASGTGILVTGANGFVGAGLLHRLCGEDIYRVRGTLRHEGVRLPPGVESMRTGDLEETMDWSRALDGIEVVVHTAARVHDTGGAGLGQLAAYRRANVAVTLGLARQAAAAGVRRFVFLSTLKVNGEETPPDAPFAAEDPPAPSGAYAISKREAEDGLRDLARDTGLEVVVIRPPLVYGPGVKGNFLRMMRWLARGIPLPLGAVRNRRSLVSLDNLADLIVACVRHPAAANHVFLAADGEDLSTPELLKRTGTALGVPARLFDVPLPALKAAAAVVGRRDVFRRLCASLQADIGATREFLGWAPPASVDDALRATAREFLSR
jgi:nucleoside-diphosphate-sugar epimerase